ncbi:MAG TPA: crossover junction endodeoxyribonuclease RuvC [Clostridia bacterium]|nr:crossover junction endodeoxyribonuclease RuvC [Clostridia bacterium]
MIILGIDPGIAITGYGVIDVRANNFKMLDYGVIRSSSELETAQRLKKIHRAIGELIKKHQPIAVAMEELFFNKNVRSAFSVGRAQGVVMLAGCELGLPVYEYTPLQVKQAVVGYGRADKQQVQFMVKTILNLRETPTPDDAADALAIAICHSNFYSSGLGRKGV